MLFHTVEFLFFFLPATLLGYYLLGRAGVRAAFSWLAFCSLFFYGWWNPRYLLLIGCSIAVNYAGSRVISMLRDGQRERATRAALASLIAGNLLALAYFKYLGFFAAQWQQLTGLDVTVGNIILPIGISFYTFTQIAFLVDTAMGKVREQSLLAYILFVSYFPHLVAGPVLHHAEMMPQFGDSRALSINPTNLAAGTTFFAFGLFKKVFVADGVAPLANAAFAAGLHDGASFTDAWLGALAYSVQIYFDFSGYSDMAVGLSLLFNIKLPINFFSPYRATNIIEFWRRWHITLSRFLRDYLYIPLGGNRRGPSRRYVNLLLTMLLGGLWHGANWTFVVWGGLHGVYLMANHLWRFVAAGANVPRRFPATYRAVSWAVTLLAVVVGWVFFRSESVTHAMGMLRGMAGLQGFGMALGSAPEWALVAGAGVWALCAPNTNQVMDYFFGWEWERDSGSVRWRPTGIWASVVVCLFVLSAFAGLTGRRTIEFLYFQF